jgi:predicted amidohydrolase YtcJ
MRLHGLPLIGAFIASASLAAWQSNPVPSLLVLNARIFTGVPATPWAEAVSIVGDRIGAVGTTDDVRKLAGPGTRLIDAAAQLVIPGINDAHVHITAEPQSASLAGPPAFEQDPSLDEVLKRLAAAVGKAPRGSWIFVEIGERVLDNPNATRFTLDAIAPDHFVVITSWTGHGSLFNTAALRRLDVRDDEPDPPGGFFVRVAGQKSITGLAHEYADTLMRQRISMIPDEQAQIAALRDFGQRAVSFGITSVQWMLTSRTVRDAARTAVAAGVPLRIRLIEFPMTGMSTWREPAARTVKGAPGVTVSGTKWILDGTPIERLMFLREPYSDRPDTRGRLNFPDEQVVGYLRKALTAGEQPMFHAVGDAAIDTVLNGLERTGAEQWTALRPRIEHGDMVEPSHFDRVRRFGVCVVQNPSHFMLAATMRERLGDRARRVMMMKSLMAANVPVALGSDGPLNPFLNVMFATINANNPSEAMTREQAITAYTLGSARAEFAEGQKGTIAPGMLADLAILSQNIFTVATDALPATTSVLTLVGGKVAFEKN